MMRKTIEAANQLIRNENGAVTVDWVGLMGATLLLSVAIVSAIFNHGVAPVTQVISSSLAGAADMVSSNVPPEPPLESVSGDQTQPGAEPPPSDYRRGDDWRYDRDYD